LELAVYIACEQVNHTKALEGRVVAIKVGRSANPKARLAGLRGAVPTRYCLLGEFPCLDSERAERLILLRLRGVAKQVAPTLETFKTSVSVADVVCREVVAHINSTTQLQVKPLLQGGRLTHSLKRWRAILATPVKLKKTDMTLGALMTEALTNAAAHIQLVRLGVECVQFSATKPVFRFNSKWSLSQGLDEIAAFKLLPE
jgi:hypothetical protein